MATNYDVDKMELQPSKLDGIIKRAKPIIANAKARMREAMDVVYEAYLEVGGQKGRSNTKTFSRACEEMGIHERQAYRLKNMKEVELGLRLPDPIAVQISELSGSRERVDWRQD